MLLALDVGNSHTVVGGFDGDRLAFEVRLKSEAGRTADEFGATLLQLVERSLGGRASFAAAIVCSVVPSLTTELVQMVNRWFGIEPMVLGPGIKTGISVRSSDPTAVGADRIANSVAAKELYGAPVLIVDFGTATSFDYVGSNGAYEGSVIAPGVLSGLNALVQRTAKLPQIEIAWPRTMIGKSTVHAMQVGTVIGHACVVEGLIRKIIQEVGPIQNVVATGDLAGIFAEHCPEIKHVDHHLTLKGLRIIAGLNA